MDATAVALLACPVCAQHLGIVPGALRCPAGHSYDLARQGYLIRTRVDGQGNIDADRRQQALSSGAHVLTTDYPSGEIAADRAFGLPDHAPARVNPITGPENLRGKLLQEPIGE